MTCYRVLLVFILAIICVSTEEETTQRMTKAERVRLREESRRMFYHAYNAYMDNAYPADELMPLSCQGRWRGVTPSRGDMDDVLGNFSLTLVDSLDTLAVMGDFSEFSRAIKLVIRDVTFDHDIIVSVFETNIRMVGGLLSAHVLATALKNEVPALHWYNGELLQKAEDLGRRLLPAFNTSTGIPHGRVNLRHGIRGLSESRETCTACAGTMILEMAALSRLTGNPVFEQKAHKAMDGLWKIRHRTSDLMGTVINIHSGDWVRKDSGVGAGIDSYYEYCLKAYILLGDEKYLARFNRHYNAVMKYISRGPIMLAVHMHRTCPNTASLVAEKVRRPMRQMLGSTAARPPARLRPLNDPRQIHALADMGISVLTLPDGRVQLLYTAITAKSQKDAAEGLTFMREMSKWNALSDTENGVVAAGVKINDKIFPAGPGHFGKEITGNERYVGTVNFAYPSDACSAIKNKDEISGKFSIAKRGQCTFAQKVRHLQDAGAHLAIVLDNVKESTHESTALFAMSGDGKDDIQIPAVFLFSKEGAFLKAALKENPGLILVVGELKSMKREYENSCDNGNCDLLESPVSMDKESLDLKRPEAVVPSTSSSAPHEGMLDID
ncbi:unnamed protein product [Colias eurytheme]|nr:unnamed protein product [Colias eurytheme]